MHLPPSAFGAYREDLRRSSPRTALGPADHEWLLAATGLERLAQLPAPERATGARRLAAAFQDDGDAGGDRVLAQALETLATREGSDALLSRSRAICADMERAGALLLARVTLDAAVVVGAEAGPRERGLAIVQQGRILRTIGEIDEARGRYEAAIELGTAEAMDEVAARASIGLGVLARTRGNYPEARRRYETGLELATRAEADEVVGLAHHGLLAVAAAAGELSVALVHGWEAFRHAAGKGGDAEAEALFNLAHLCLDAGHSTASLSGNLSALSRTSSPRLRLGAIGGAAEASARLGRVEVLERMNAAMDGEAHESFPFETARAWASIAKAYHGIGNAAASTRAAGRARSLAKAGGFFEVMYALDQLRTAAQSSTRSGPATPAKESHLTDAARDVVRSIEHLEPAEDGLLITAGRSTGY